MISDFRKEYFFLSNFYERPLEYGGLTYQSSEAAFQAQKTFDLAKRYEFTKMSPSEAKKAGKFVTLRSDWEDAKMQIMYEVCLAKFKQNEDLAQRLLATGFETLVEGNNWGDIVWGMVNGIGENKLGKCLMRVRNELRDYDAEKELNAFNPKVAYTQLCVWLTRYFADRMPDDKACYAVIDIDGTRNSAICVKLLYDAIGVEYIHGLTMAARDEKVMNNAMEIVDWLCIHSVSLYSHTATEYILGELKQSYITSSLTPKRVDDTITKIFMAEVADEVGGKTVSSNTLSDITVGNDTKHSAVWNDLMPFANLTRTEVLAIGRYMNVPHKLLYSDVDIAKEIDFEHKHGFSYSLLDEYIRKQGGPDANDVCAYCPAVKKKIENALEKLVEHNYKYVYERDVLSAMSMNWYNLSLNEKYD